METIAERMGPIDIRYEDVDIAIIHDGCFTWVVDDRQFRQAMDLALMEEVDDSMDAGAAYDRFWTRITRYAGPADDGRDADRLRKLALLAGYRIA